MIVFFFFSYSNGTSPADSRTDKPLKLGDALLQHQHVGIISNDIPTEILPLQDPAQSTIMPEAWVR